MSSSHGSKRRVHEAVSGATSTREVLHLYAGWYVLRWIWQRNRGTSLTHGELDTARQQALAQLAARNAGSPWLPAVGPTSASGRPEDVTRKAEARHFVRWIKVDAGSKLSRCCAMTPSNQRSRRWAAGAALRRYHRLGDCQRDMVTGFVWF
jgi:hypothetical protein